MKKFMMIAAMMVMTIAAKAQNEVGQVTLKPMVGFVTSTITDGNNVDPKCGFAAGVEAEYGMTEKFALSVGAIYSQQGAKFPDLNDAKLNLEYINVPILANFYVAKGFALKVGVQPGFKTSSKIKVGDVEASTSLLGSKDGVKSFDFSIPLGLSYEFSSFVIDARYNVGVTKVLDIEDATPRNSYLTISVGYKFAL